MTTTDATSVATPTTRRALRAWLLWTVGFVAFPLSGIAGMLVVGRVDGPAAAALGGLATGAVLGAGQALASSRRLPAVRWIVATAVGTGVGLLLGAHAVDYGTSLGRLAVMGAVTGAVLGVAQAMALPARSRHRWLWAVAMPVLWALGWAVTTVAGVAVDEQFTVFGATGALTVTALLGLLLQLLLPPVAPAPGPTPTPTPATTNPDGDQS
jgi:Na+-translocating ferredoxin:NAD+ oxidoreductase RnfE subunit